MQKTILALGLLAQVHALELGSVSEAGGETANKMAPYPWTSKFFTDNMKQTQKSYTRSQDGQEVVDDHGQLHSVLPTRDEANFKLISPKRKIEKKDFYQKFRSIKNRSTYSQTPISYGRDGKNSWYVKKPTSYGRRGSN